MPRSPPPRLRLPRNSCQQFGNHPFGAHVIAALQAAGRSLTNDELAAAMGVHKGEATKRPSLVAHRLLEQRDGRFVRVSLRAPN